MENTKMVPMTSSRLGMLLFLAAAVPLGALGFAVLVAGWVVVAVLAVTPLVVPALLGFRIAVGATARIEAELANALLGTSARPPLTTVGPRGYWRSGGNVLRDRAFWQQQAYLLIRLSLGFAVAIGEWTLLATSLGLIALPIWYRWSAPELSNSWKIDTLDRALLGIPLGLAGLAIAIALLRPLARWSRALAVSLLGGAPAEARRIDAGTHLRSASTAYAVLNALLIVIWALAGRGYFWPEWTLISLGLPLAASFALTQAPRRWKGAGVFGAFAAFFTVVWAVTGAGYFWPAWPILGVGLALAAVAWVVSRERIAVLEETRAGVVDHQESELVRIERDLHDGAQARLVALGMSLGLAEQKLVSDPAGAQELLAEARRGTREALEELRNLARGIHPPVLADRGLEAAIETLARRTPLRVEVSVDVPQRPPRPVETAAYFVVAEALANTGKHAHAEQVDIAVRSEDGSLLVEVVDNGAGGADPQGNGLRGLAQRVEALDGRLEVDSPPGGPTTVRAVIPCGS